MIQPGTPCLIIASVQQPQLVGRYCTLISYEISIIAAALGLNCLVDIPGSPARSPDGLWATHTACLLPLDAGPDEVLLFEVEQEQQA